ncbi:MAG: hypothetical protein JSS07_12570 [Proteobacteria bacterium]|nr:hypothetical protein [Pseudomonadota bacterium]
MLNQKDKKGARNSQKRYSLNENFQGNEPASEYYELLQRQQQLQMPEHPFAQQTIQEQHNLKNQQEMPQALHHLPASFRFFLGVGVIGPIAGFLKYILDPLSLIFAISAILIMSFAFSASWALTLGVSFIAHACPALYQTFITSYPTLPSIVKTAKASEFIQQQTLQRPIAKAILFGFKTANKVAGIDNEPYGKQACELCLQLENRNLKLR